MIQTNTLIQTGRDARFKRNNRIIRLKLYQYLIPSVLTIAATSLEVFMDSLVIAQILGQESMTMVNMASPISLVYSTLFTLFGMGGSTVYASLKGQMKEDEASTVFSLTMMILAISGTLISALGIIFLGPVTRLLSNGLAVPKAFSDYVLILIISAPFTILLQGFLMFLPAEGKPHIAMLINIITNVVNIILDVIFTTVCHMQVTGAACATLTGYIIGILFLVILRFFNKFRVPFGRISRSSLTAIKSIIEKGAASAVGQFGFLAKVSFSNHIAVLYAGSTGIAVFAACYQTIAVTSIFLGGLVYAMIPLLAVLHSQEDYDGIRILMKEVTKITFIISVAIFLLFEAFPVRILNAYNICGADSFKMGISALRIFSFMYLFRQLVMIMIFYAQTVGMKYYAVILGIIEGFAGTIILTKIFTPFMGITGLWFAYPACSALLIIGIAAVNRFIASRSNGRLKGFFLIPSENADHPSLYFTLNEDIVDISEFSKVILNEMKEKGMDDKRSNIVATVCKELGMYTNEHDKKHRTIDVVIRLSGSDIHINFCSIGPAFSHLYGDDVEGQGNLSAPRKLVKKFSYNYIIGMNEIHMVI